MAVVAGGGASRPHVADQLALRHGLPGLHHKGRHMAVQRLVAVAVVNLHIIAPARGRVIVPLGSDDRARVGSVNRRAVGRGDVHPAVAIG